jgi:hypothetical protein
MFTLTLFATLASVAAFAPAGRMTSSSALRMGFESEIGAQPPLGFFDVSFSAVLSGFSSLSCH